ncbi:MAG: hypothetical protein M3P93_07150 [Actinomycetota bacterium]|nr:hypothetical protein [Actinomycetota bacterium]
MRTPTLRRGVRAVLTRVRDAHLPRAVTLADQVLSSVSNVLAVVLVARALSSADFGRFALGYAVLTLALTLSRNYFGTRVSMAPDAADARRLTAELVAGMLVASPLAFLAVLVVAGLVTGLQAPGIVLVVAAATPVVLVQDLLRFGAASGGRPWVALASDGVWVALMAAPFVLGLDLDATAALVLWLYAAVSALAVALAAFGERPRLSGLRELRRRETLGASLTLGAVATTAATLLVLMVVARVLDPAAAGSLRGASTAMGPVNVLLAFAGLGVTPVLVRRARAHDRSACLAVGGVLTLLVLAWGAVLLALPADVGTALLGDSWGGVRSVLGWTVVEYVLLAAASAALLGLKVRQRAADLVRARLTLASATVLLGAGAALVLDRVTAVAAAVAVSTLLGAAVAWAQFLRDARTPGRRLDDPGPLLTDPVRT